jgi:hypothetical protein
MQANTTSIAIVALLPLIGWRIYSRVKRMVGRQRLSRIRPWATLIVFPLVVALLGLMAFQHPQRLWWLAGGLAAGVLLAQYGLRKTQFEATPQGLFYTPNAHLGIALSLLFVGRIVYRLVQLVLFGPQVSPAAPDDFAYSPWTLSIFGLLAGYYIGYAAGLVRWRIGVLRGKRNREAEI